MIDFLSMISWVQNHTFICGIATGLITSFLGWLISLTVKRIWFEITARSNDLTGEWKQEIFARDDPDCLMKPIKTDLYKLTYIRRTREDQLCINVKGTIQRSGKSGRNREWDFIGYYYNDVMTIIYQSKKTGDMSRGCIYLMQVRDETQEDELYFKGYYLAKHGKTTETEMLDKTPLKLTKIEKRK